MGQPRCIYHNVSGAGYKKGVIFWKNNNRGHIEIKIKENFKDQPKENYNIPKTNAFVIRVQKNANDHILSEILKEYKENGSIEKSKWLK